MEIEKSESKKPKVFFLRNRFAFTGAVLSFALIGSGTAYASITIEDLDLPRVCVTATLAEDSKFMAKRGSCLPEGAIPAPEPVIVIPEPEVVNAITKLVYKCDTTVIEPLPFGSVKSGATITVDGNNSQKVITANFTTEKVTLEKDIEYKVTIDGQFNSFTTFSYEELQLPHCLRSIETIGALSGVRTIGELGRNLTDVPKTIPASVTSLRGVFQMNPVFNDPDISSWNTSNVTTMNRMFLNATGFNQPIGNWNVSKVSDVDLMFSNADVFNQDLNNWDTSSMLSMYSMFSNAYAFNQDLNSWDTSNVQDFNYMFEKAIVFNGSIDKWDTTAALDMQQMFLGATSFNQPIGGWKTAGVTKMGAMFQDATSFNQPLDQWDTSAVSEMDSMFFGATKFNQPISGWKTGNVIEMYYMFRDAKSFNQNISNWNVDKVTDYVDFSVGSALETAKRPLFK